MLNFYEKFDFGAIFDFLDFQKGTIWTPFSATKAPTNPNVSWAGRPCRDPAFHETIVILVPLGPSVFKNTIVSIEFGYF